MYIYWANLAESQEDVWLLFNKDSNIRKTLAKMGLKYISLCISIYGQLVPDIWDALLLSMLPPP